MIVGAYHRDVEQRECRGVAPEFSYTDDPPENAGQGLVPVESFESFLDLGFDVCAQGSHLRLCAVSSRAFLSLCLSCASRIAGDHKYIIKSNSCAPLAEMHG